MTSNTRWESRAMQGLIEDITDTCLGNPYEMLQVARRLAVTAYSSIGARNA